MGSVPTHFSVTAGTNQSETGDKMKAKLDHTYRQISPLKQLWMSCSESSATVRKII